MSLKFRSKLNNENKKLIFASQCPDSNQFTNSILHKIAECALHYTTAHNFKMIN